MTEIHSTSSRTAATWGFVVAVTATLSTLIQITFDEAIWVWAGREIFAGGIPYREVVDHKTVLVFGLEALFDLAPGAFEVARGLGVGVTIAGIGIMGSALFRRVGGEHRFALSIGLLSAAVAFLQTRLVSTVELWATAALLGALLLLASRKYRLAAAVTCLGAMIDIRAIALVPVASLFAAEQGGRSALRKYITILAPLLLITTAVVLAFPDVRFGVIELAAASRSSQFYPFDQAMVGVRALILPAVLIPIFVGVNPGSIRSAARRSGTLLLVSAIAIAAISRLPFARYWTFVVLAIPVIAGQLQNPVARPTRDGGPTRAMIAGLVTFALLPGIFRIVNETLVIDSRTS